MTNEPTTEAERVTRKNAELETAMRDAKALRGFLAVGLGSTMTVHAATGVVRGHSGYWHPRARCAGSTSRQYAGTLTDQTVAVTCKRCLASLAKEPGRPVATGATAPTPAGPPRDMNAQHAQLTRMVRAALHECEANGLPRTSALHDVLSVDHTTGVLAFRSRYSGRTGTISADGARVTMDDTRPLEGRSPRPYFSGGAAEAALNALLSAAAPSPGDLRYAEARARRTSIGGHTLAGRVDRARARVLALADSIEAEATPAEVAPAEVEAVDTLAAAIHGRGVDRYLSSMALAPDAEVAVEVHKRTRTNVVLRTSTGVDVLVSLIDCGDHLSVDVEGYDGAAGELAVESFVVGQTDAAPIGSGHVLGTTAVAMIHPRPAAE